jgi:hypothetical protein
MDGWDGRGAMRMGSRGLPREYTHNTQSMHAKASLGLTQQRTVGRELVADKTRTELLNEYWARNKAGETTAPQPLKETPLGSPAVSFKSTPQKPRKGHTRNRSASDGAALLPPGHTLSLYHPARSLHRLLETFGPLVFPIYRAALLRKRILISTHAPVLESCNFGKDGRLKGRTGRIMRVTNRG